MNVAAALLCGAVAVALSGIGDAPLEETPQTESAAASPEPASPREPPPRPGTGRLVGGGILLGQGVLSLLSAVVSLQGDARTFSFVNVATGGVQLVTGVAVVISGVVGRRKFDAWVDERVRSNAEPPPRTGNGYLTAGTLLLGTGLATLTATGLLDGGASGYVNGGVQSAAGVALTTIGAIRRARFDRWRRTEGFVLRPTFGLARGGAVIGAMGRF